MPTTTEEGDSKYTVADILSSMANGDPITPSAFSGPTFTSLASMTTPTLTPTTLANIEQTFIELQSVPVTTSAYTPITHSGFVPPVIEYHQGIDYKDTDTCSTISSASDPDWAPSSPSKKPRLGGSNSVNTSRIVIQPAPNGRNKGGRKRKDAAEEKLTPEESRRRGMRRERNKVAAAKCRQRRVDTINTLSAETENLEDHQSNLEDEISSLQQQKEQLEFILQAHRPMCKHSANNGSVIVKTNKPKLSEPVKSRPTTLPITTVGSSTATEATGIPITTPSNGIISFAMDSESTGLTPLCGPPISCASDITNCLIKSEPGSELLTPTTLVAL